MKWSEVFFSVSLFALSTSIASATEELNEMDQPVNSCRTILSRVHQLRTREAIFLERFPKHLESFIELVQNVKTSEEFVEKSTDTDMRQFLFRLETLEKFYLDHFKDSRNFNSFDVAFLKAKKLEGVLGAVVDAKSMLKKAIAWQRPAKEIEIWTAELEFKKKELALCYEEDWKSPNIPALQQLEAVMDGMAIPSQKEDAKYVADRIAKKAKEIQKAKYDMTILEGATPEEKKASWHKQKRDLRQIAIFFNSMLGKIAFLEKKVPARMQNYQELSDVAKSYMKIDQSELADDIKHVVYYYQYDYNALSFFINWFDQIKKWGELHDEFLRVAIAANTYSNRAVADKTITAMLKQQVPGWKPWQPEAKTAKQALDESGLLDDFMKGAK